MPLPGIALAAGLLAATGLPNDGIVVTDDPLHYANVLNVTFDGANGSTTFTDDSIWAHALTAAGNAQIQNNKLELDGTGDFVTIPDHWSWTPSAKVSYELWGVEFDDTVSDQVLLSHYDSLGEHSWSLSYQSGVLRFTTATGGVATNRINASWTPIAGTPYDICVTWDGATLRAYVDRTFVGSEAWAGPISNSATLLRIGCDLGTGTPRRFFNGRLSAIRITYNYDRAGGSTTTYVGHVLPLATSGTPAGDPYFAYVVALVAPNAGNTALVDHSIYARALTVNGNASMASADPVVGSNYTVLDGTGDFWTLANDDELSVAQSNQDFTIEGWVYVSVGGRLNTISNKRDGGSADEHGISFDTANKLNGTLFTAGSAVLNIVGTTVISTGGWYYYAFVRQGTACKLFLAAEADVNTTLEGSGTQSSAPSSNAGVLYLGRDGFNTSRDLNGRLTEYRFTRYARYTAAFATPTAAFPRL